MQMIIIDNLLLTDGILHAVGRDDKETMVFLKQGDFIEKSSVCSLMMMLMFHKRINREELLHKVSSNAPTYIKELKKRFLLTPPRGYLMMDLQKKLLRSFNNQIDVDVFSVGSFDDEADLNKLRKLHLMIKGHLDAGKPVLIGFDFFRGVNWHYVVAIGYMMYGKTLRLFCLDPAYDLQYTSIWNNVIDINMNFHEDYDYMEYEVVHIESILLIDKQDLPFEREEINSISPF